MTQVHTEQAHSRPNNPASIGVMGYHVMTEGEFMLSLSVFTNGGQSNLVVVFFVDN